MADLSAFRQMYSQAFAGLPKWGRVAFAVRCGRRLQAICEVATRTRLNWEPASFEKLERACATAADVDWPADAVEKAAVKWAEYVRRASLTGALPTVHPVLSAAFDYLSKCAFALAVESDEGSLNLLSQCVTATQECSGLTGIGDAREAMYDVYLLKSLTVEEGWGNDTPIPLDLFGAMWTFGEPEGWRSILEPSASANLRLEFALPAGLARETGDEIIGELLQRANELHVAFGGSGLQIVRAKAYEPALEGVSNGGDA
jgi:hypothetical protein